MKAPLVSVILPFANGMPIIERLLRQLETQSLIDEIELVAVDFGSTDGSLDRVRSFASRHPATKVVKVPKKRGLSGWFNEGVSQASGEFVVFTAEDCYPVASNTVERLVREIRQSPNSRTCVGPTLSLPRELWDQYDFWSKLWFARDLGRKPCVAVKFDILPRSEFLKLGGIDEESFVWCGDADFYLRWTREGGTLKCSDVEVVHAHSAGKNTSLNWYLRRELSYGEMSGALRRRHPRDFSGGWYGVVAKPLLCLGALIPHVGWICLPLLAFYAVFYRWNAYKSQSPLTPFVPFFNLLGLYVFSVGYLRGLIKGKQSLFW